jgi:dTDP-4-dehydrorhamnose 3,5-epimerase
MEMTALEIDGCWLANSSIWHDKRGYFREWFNVADIEKLTGRNFVPEQANISLSSEGTLRGIHYSVAERGQAKWITCVTGSIRDFVIDIRSSSPTFGKWIMVELSAKSGNAVLIGEGLGHAFVSMEDNTTVAYLLSSPYSPHEEHGINPMDPELGINWGIDASKILLSEKDRLAPFLFQQKLSGQLPK